MVKGKELVGTGHQGQLGLLNSLSGHGGVSRGYLSITGLQVGSGGRWGSGTWMTKKAFAAEVEIETRGNTQGDDEQSHQDPNSIAVRTG